MHRIILSLFLLLFFISPHASMEAAPTDNTNAAAGSKIISAPKVEAPKVDFTSVRWLVHKDAVDGTSKLRVVIDTTGPVKVSSDVSGDSDPQLVVTVTGATVGKLSDSVALDGDIADKVDFIKKDGNTSKIVVNLSNMVDESDYKVFTLKSDISNKKPFRIVIDINKPVPIGNFTFTPGLKDKVVVLDPGHGGSDPGAIGPNKTQEKTITLAVAQKVKALLESADIKVIMTRQTDVDVYGPNASATDELQARSNVGNDNKADVFISIHINAFTNPVVGGIATYYNQKTGYDAMLAKNIQSDLAAITGVVDRGISSARFYVLRKTRMPAILTELGFISNPDEEKRMSTPQFQQQMAKSIVQGLEDFFTQAAKKGGGS